jgi:hypothetical protein
MAKNNPEPKREKDAERDHAIWSAIRYLDPDQERKAPAIDAVVPVIILLLVFFIVWLLPYLRTL